MTPLAHEFEWRVKQAGHLNSKMRLVTEENLEKFLFDNTTKWQDAVIASDGVWWGFQDISFAERYQSWIDSTWTTEQSKHAHYGTKVFSNTSHAELALAKKFNKGKRFVRVLTDIDFTANVWVCGDYLVMIVTDNTRHTLSRLMIRCSPIMSVRFSKNCGVVAAKIQKPPFWVVFENFHNLDAIRLFQAKVFEKLYE